MKRDIKYILKRVLIGVLISIILFNLKSCNVRALEINGAYYSSPPNVSFYANPSLTSHTYMGGTFNSTWGIFSSSAIQGLGGTNDAHGADVCIGLDQVLKSDYLYSAAFILNNGSNAHYTVASSNNTYAMLRGGYALNTAINNANSVDIYYFGTVPSTNISSGFSNTGDIMNFMFVPHGQYNVMCFPFKTQSSTSLIHNLLGYHIQVIGNTGGLSTTDIQNIVSNNMNGVYSSLAGVESNLSNQIQGARAAIVAEEKKTTEAVEDVNDTLKDDTTDDPDSKLNEVSGKVATNNVISDLVLLPVTLFSKVLDSLNSNCTSYNLGSLYNHNIVFPCINVADYIGSVLWGVIDVLISGLLIYAISRKFIKVFNELSSLKEGDIID